MPEETVASTTTLDLDALADKLASRLAPPPSTKVADYQVLAFTVLGSELRATVKTPSGDVYQGVVSNWQKVTVVEVPK